MESIRKDIVAKVNSGSPVTIAIFNGAMNVLFFAQISSFCRVREVPLEADCLSH